MFIPSVDLQPGEKLVAEVPANLFRGWEGVGGRLYITDRRIRFESHRLNFQSGPTEIRLSEVTSVGPHNYLGIVRNGMEVRTAVGQRHRFVVWERWKLIELIQKGMPHGQDEGNPETTRVVPGSQSRGVWDRDLDGSS
jgi:hypothetical protein